MRNETVIMNGALGMIWEETGVAYFRVLFRMQKKLRGSSDRMVSKPINKQTKGDIERKKGNDKVSRT
jgi:hypothetical protein